MRFLLFSLLAGSAAVACASNESTDLPATSTSTAPTTTFDASTTPDATATSVVPDAAAPTSPATDASFSEDAAPEASVPPPPPPPPPTITVTTESITVWSTARSYVLAVPSTYDASRTYPLVLALHGDYQDGAAMRDKVRFDDASGQNAIVAYPTGSSQSWNLYAPVDQDSDVAFLVAVVDALRARFHIGSAFGFGMSSGAFMVNQMACRRPSLFKGIISHSGGVPDEPNASHGTWGTGWVRCNGQDSGVAAMIIHGRADEAVAFPSGENDANYWSTVNGCSSGYAAASPSPCTTRNGCPSDKPVVFCAIDGLGHALWDQAAAAAWVFISGF